MNDSIQVITRATEPEDKNFILSTWLNGNRYGNPYFKRMDSAEYYKAYSEHIISVLTSPGTQINIACDSANPSWIVGFAVFRDETLYWVHIKEDFRRNGVATLLLKDAPITTVKGLTKLGWSILQKKGLIYDPRK